jgi:hypothetical protein
MHPALLNGHPKCTVIQSFSGEVFILRPGFRKEFGKDLKDAKAFADKQGWEINIEIIKGSPAERNIREG